MNNSVECSDKTQLHQAAITGSTEEAKRLIFSGAAVNAQTRRGRTPLHYAAENGYNRIVVLLLMSGAQVDLPNKWGRTALHYAASKHRVECVQTLINKGADLNCQDVDGQTPLYHAVAAGKSLSYEEVKNPETQVRHTGVCDTLPCGTMGRDSKMRDVEACHIRHTTLLLITQGANPDISDKSGITPLHVAAEQGNTEICVQLIKEANAHINAIDQHGATPLHYACYQRHRHIAKLLISHGSCSTAEDNSGLFAGTYLEKRRNDGPDIENNASEFVPIKNVDEINGGSFLTGETDFSSLLLKIDETEGVGRVKQTEEVQKIERDIRYYIETTLREMVSVEPRLRYVLVKAGSTAENTKVGEPDELDYMCCLSDLSKVSFPCISHDDLPGHARIKIQSHGLRTWGDFVNKDGFVEAKKLHQWFHFVFDRFSEISDLTAMSTCLHKMRDYTPRPELGVTVDMSQTKPGSRLYFMWRGCQYKRLIVTVDLIPVIEILGWPHGAQVPPQKGCDRYHVIPKVSPAIRTNLPVGLFWRISTALAEKCLFNGMEPPERVCYRVCKSLVHLPDSKRLLSSVIMSFSGSLANVNGKKRESEDEDCPVYSTADDIQRLSFVLEQLMPYKQCIHSYHLKMVLFRLRDKRRERSDWTWRRVGPRVLEILNMLLKELKQSYVPSFFLLGYNELAIGMPTE